LIAGAYPTDCKLSIAFEKIYISNVIAKLPIPHCSFNIWYTFLMHIEMVIA